MEQVREPMSNSDMARVLEIMLGVWDRAVDLATADGIPQDRHAEIAGAILTKLLDSVQLPNDQLAERMGRTYVALAREILNGGK